MFFPNPNFGPTESRTLLRPPFSTLEKKIIVSNVDSYTKTKVRVDLPGEPASGAVKCVRYRRAPVQERADRGNSVVI